MERSFFWNSISSILNASQTFLFLLVIKWYIGLEEVGFFSYAFSLVNQYLSIGRFGMRNYQVTDTTCKYAFCTYLRSRFITTGCMFLVALFYSGYLYCTGKYPVLLYGSHAGSLYGAVIS